MQAKKIQDVMTPRPACLPEGAMVNAAAALMREKGIGDVIICKDDGSVCGIVTDRDIATRCVAVNRDPTHTPVAEICSQDPIRLHPDDSIELAIKKMADESVRRLIVTEGDRAVGVVSLGDLALDRDPESALGSISAASPQA